MKAYSLFLSLIIFSLISFQQQTPFQQTDFQVFADSLFQVHLDSAHLAGASIKILSNGESLLDKAYGKASLELDVPMPANAVFEIGSVTKQFTAAAILRLVEEGKLKLSDHFTDYLKFDTKGRLVTINQLLDHTSGIPSYTEIAEFWDLSLHDEERDSLLRVVEANAFLFEPGEALIYNNSAYFILGLIIEKLSGKSYEEYLREQFFEPLQMHHTYYCSNSVVVSNKVYGYDFSPNGLRQRPYLDHTWPYAAGSLCSTSEDLQTWLTALHSGKVLTEQQYTNLITPKTLNDGSRVRYAKGITNFDNYGNQEISHGGGINGFLSDTKYFPEKDLYMVCLVNTTGPNGASFFLDQLAWQLLDKKEVSSLALDIDLNELEGTYSGAARGRTLSIVINSLGDALSVAYEGSKAHDTLRTYLGNSSWRNGNDLWTINGESLSIDQVAGHYVLKK